MPIEGNIQKGRYFNNSRSTFRTIESLELYNKMADDEFHAEIIKNYQNKDGGFNEDGYG